MPVAGPGRYAAQHHAEQPSPHGLHRHHPHLGEDVEAPRVSLISKSSPPDVPLPGYPQEVAVGAEKQALPLDPPAVAWTMIFADQGPRTLPSAPPQSEHPRRRSAPPTSKSSELAFGSAFDCRLRRVSAALDAMGASNFSYREGVLF